MRPREPRLKEKPPEPRIPSANKTPGNPRRTVGRVSDARTRFLARVLARIEKAKRYPVQARRKKIEGTAKVEFMLSAQGKILSVTVLSSSGNLSLDKEALAMVRRAGPYPRIPEELGLAEMKLSLPITFHLEQGR